MVHYTSTLVALTSLVATALAAPATIDTPTSLVQCQPYKVSWSQGEGGPYYVTVIPGGQAGAAPLENLGTFPAGTTSYTWNVDLAAGTSITLQIVDSAGTPNYSQQVTIREGSTTTCAAAAGGSSAAAGASSAATSAEASATASRTGRAASVASSAQSMATSAVAAASSVASQATSAGGAAASSAAASARPTSGASSLAVGSALGAVGLVAALML